MKPQKRDDQIASAKRMSQWLCEHVILRHEERGDGVGFLEIGKPTRSFEYRVTFSLTPGGYLTMTGDISTVCWAHYAGQTVEGALRWMVRADPRDHYFMEKASIGMGGRDLIHTYDAGIAFGDIIEYRKQAVEDGEKDEAEGWANVLRAMADGETDRESVMNYVSRVDHDWERAESIGMMPAWRLIWGWMLIRRAVELLDATGPSYPDCCAHKRTPRRELQRGERPACSDMCVVGPGRQDAAWECEDCEQSFTSFTRRQENSHMDWFCGRCDDWQRCAR